MPDPSRPDSNPPDERPTADDSAALFENTTDAIVAVELRDRQFIVTAVNPAFEATFGYDADEIVGKDIDEYVLPDKSGEAAQSVGDLMQSAQQVDQEVRRQTATGVRDFRIRTVPLERGGGWTGGYAIYTDITAQKERQAQLERFTQIVSHDLRNPLQVATSQLELLGPHETPPPVTEAIDTASVALDRMSEIIGDLLVLTRSGKQSPELEPTAIGAAADCAWQTVDTGSATLDCRCPIMIDADRAKLGHCLENLFRNAVEHAGDDVTVTVGPLDDAAGFFVADDGPGIPESERERVFEDGYTTDEDGTGFGLSIVAMVAETHGWVVSVTDSEPSGTRFEFLTDL
ncbi:MAG: sensor histidine kinase [Halorientalis sp.]